MRNFELYLTPAENRRFLDRHLQTEEVRRATRESQVLSDMLTAFCRYPRLAFTPDDEVNERSNFTAWYNALAVRKYVNPAVNDLYYLHEIAHIVTMPYKRGSAFASWKLKMFQNELRSSVFSEAHIYLLVPGLRAISFAGEIWVDRYLERLRTRPLDEALLFLTKERTRIQAATGLTDPQEIRIHEYQSQNEKWAALWEKRFDQVEGHMVEFYEQAGQQPASALRWHHNWILKEIETSGAGKPFPFAAEVEEFARLTALTKTPAAAETKIL